MTRPDTIKEIPCPGRVLINRTKIDDRPQIKDVVRLSPGDQQYDPTYPWEDLGAYKTVAQISDRKRDGAETFNEITIDFANHNLPCKNIPYNSRYTLAILHKSYNSAYINGLTFSDVSVLQINYPRISRGESSLIKVVFGFSNINRLKPQAEYRR